MPTLTIDPLTRVEGHLGIEVTVEAVAGQQQVVEAKSSGTMFRGFEAILQGRDPRDATHYTQRVCGVCPISHGMASTLALEHAFGVTPPANGRILRNLVLGANYLQSHILHFYHLAALDYINTTGILDLSPFTPRYVTPEMVSGTAAADLVGHYVEALAMRRKAHQMGAIMGGKLPGSPVFVPGGSTQPVTSQQISDFQAILAEISAFIDARLVPDTLAVASLFPEYYQIGSGCQNLISYGVFDQDDSDANKLLNRGRYTNGLMSSMDPAQIAEFMQSSYYSSPSGLNPMMGMTTPDATKAGAYSWIKAPRYASEVHEVGPLARMWVNGDYRHGISVLDRVAARALEAQKVAAAMADWLLELVPGEPSYTYVPEPASASGIGLTEAPRGALGHWLGVSNYKVSQYQIISPTSWNASPKDDFGMPGPIEQALVGTPVADINQPIEVLRVVHSFDPCLSCSVHLIEPKRGTARILATATL